MNRNLVSSLLLLLSSVCAFGQLDSTSSIYPYYLKYEDVASSLQLLPPPPAAGSAHFLYDQYQYMWGKSQRDTPRGDIAVSDARVTGDGVPFSFSEAFGITISQETTPEIYTLVMHMREDAGNWATKEAKEYYNRVRPFNYYQEQTCNPEDQARLSTNGSYPSGHTSIGWATALVLAEINVPRQNEILKRGYEMGQSRVICGYHFQSDVDAGRIVGSAVVARLHANEEFCAQMVKAKAEFAQLYAAGKIAQSTLSRKVTDH